MAFAAHIIKLKNSDIRGIEIHNERLSQNSKNETIDTSKTHLNFDALQTQEGTLTQKVNVRIKEGYKSQKSIAQHGKNAATVAVSVLVSADNDFFKTLSPEKTADFFKKATEWIGAEFGKQNIISAKVHLDETTPHMHCVVVPLTKDGRLSAKELFNAVRLKRLQDELPKHLQNNGFSVERGKEGSKNKHLSEIDYKVKQEKAKLEQLKNQIRTQKHVMKQNNISINKHFKHLEDLKIKAQVVKKLPNTTHSQILYREYSKMHGDNAVKIAESMLNDNRTTSKITEALKHSVEYKNLKNISEQRDFLKNIMSVVDKKKLKQKM